MLFRSTACGGNEPQVSGTDDAPSSSQSGDNTDIQSGEPLVLPLYNRFYLNDSELVLVKDDGSAVIDFEDGYEEESAEVQKQIDAVGKKWAGVIKASQLDRCVWLISADRQLYEITNKKATVLKENVVGFSYDDYTTILVYSDGTVEHIGERSEKYPDISGISEWTDIVQVAHGYTAVSYTHLDVYKRQCGESSGLPEISSSIGLRETAALLRYGSNTSRIRIDSRQLTDVYKRQT